MHSDRQLAPLRFLVVVLVCLFHTALYFIFQSGLKHKPNSDTASGIQVLLIVEKPVPSQWSVPPVSRDLLSRPIAPSFLTIPEFDIADVPLSNRGGAAMDSRTSGNIFDPRLREKVKEVQVRPRLSRHKSELNAWTDIHGNQYVEMGDGKCLMGMPKMDNRERGTNFAVVSCGRTDSEKMMENAMRDFDSRSAKNNSHMK